MTTVMRYLPAVAGLLVCVAGAMAEEAPAPPVPAAGQAKTLTPQEQQRAAALAKTIVGADGPAALQAVKDLRAMGDVVKPRLAAAVRERLTRDKALIDAGARRIGDAAKAKAMQDELVALRKSAVANIAKLAKDDTMRIAHENYEKLRQMQTVLNEAWMVREAMASVMVRRAELLAVWQEIAPANDAKFGPANEEALRAAAEAAIGLTVEQVRRVPEFGKDKEPADPAVWNLWFYRTCRQTEAYNRTLANLMSPEEMECVTLLNAYRESLGTLPLEVDARLLQSARRHSKEMADLGYFAHESPTASEKTHTQRMKNAGYTSGYSENIADGASGGKDVFDMWFDSPPHHQNMVHAGSTAIGVGKYGSKWTQNFGTGKRLMVMEEAERAKAAVLGTVLPPSGSAATRMRQATP